MSESTYFPVMPTLTDPDAQLAAGIGARRGGEARAGVRNAAPDYAPANDHAGEQQPPRQPPKGFFQEHKFAIIVAAIVLLIIVVVLYMYLTRKSDKRRKNNAMREEADPPNGAMFYGRGASPAPPSGPPSEEVDLEELRRLKEARRKSRAAAGDGAMGMYPEAHPEDAAGDHAAAQNGRSVTVTTVGVAIPHPPGHTSHSVRPPAAGPFMARQGPRPPPTTPPAKPKKVPAARPAGAPASAAPASAPPPRPPAEVDRAAPRPAAQARPVQAAAQRQAPPPAQPPQKAVAARSLQQAATATEAKAEDAEMELYDDNYDVADVYQGSAAPLSGENAARDDMDVLIDSLDA
jgi:hypothetical protein